MTSTFTITPRYADRKNTIPMPTWRNVMSEEGEYVGSITIHDGAWTPLYRTGDLEKPEVVATLKAAAAQMNETEDC